MSKAWKTARKILKSIHLTKNIYIGQFLGDIKIYKKVAVPNMEVRTIFIIVFLVGAFIYAGHLDKMMLEAGFIN